MNSIEIKDLSIYRDEDMFGDEKDFLSYRLFIDGVEQKGNFINISTFFVDKSSNYYTSERGSWVGEDTQYLRARRNNSYQGIDSWNYFNTCSCGHSGCSGIWNGVNIKRKKYTTEYRCRFEDGYSDGLFSTGKRFLSFPNEQIDKIREQLADIAKTVYPDITPEYAVYNLINS